MTTPERLRRRQRREGWALIFLGLMVAGSSYVDHQRDANQTDDFQRCITDQVTKLTSGLNVRGDLNAQDTEATNTVILSVARAKEYPEIAAALQKFQDDQAAIAEQRRKTKVPPFPNGKCE